MSPDAVDGETYTRYQDGQLVLCSTDEPAPPQAQRVHEAFRALVLDPEFPCLGARSAIGQRSYRFGLYDEMDSPASMRSLAQDLGRFVDERPTYRGAVHDLHRNV
jgi:FPC/CPF motif-containing protein YcgG